MIIENSELRDMYRAMVRIRAFERRVAKEFAQGNLAGVAHLSDGQEAVAVGVCMNLRPTDYVSSTHRGNGHLIAKGGKMSMMMAELYGKKTGYNKAKGGPNHITAMDIGFYANGIVGAGIPIACGFALSAKMRETGQITVCFFGDGAVNTSRFHEGVNFATCSKLPVVFVIENNVYANSTNIRETCLVPRLADRAVAYGIPGNTVDGNDVLAVYQSAGEAISRARNGLGPTLLECNTYRYSGHFEGDIQSYKPKEEREEWLKKDPIPRFREYLVGKGLLTGEDIEKIDQEVSQEVEEAVEFAQESPFPAPIEAYDHVYA